MDTTQGSELDIDTKEIFSDVEFNCRGDAISAGSVIELAEDIKIHGLLQRVILQPYKHQFEKRYKYRLVAGHRRFAAMCMLKWQVVPSKILMGLTDEEAEVINICENLKRKDLNMLQEARSLDKMAARGQTVEQIAKRLDMGKKWVRDRLALMQLPKDVQMEAAAGIIKASHIDDLLKAKNISMDKMYESVRNIKNSSARRKINVKLKPALKETVERKFRNMSDVFRIQGLIIDAIGTNLASQALAWAIGEIGVLELLAAVKYECELMQIPWSVPQYIIDAEAEAAKAKIVNVATNSPIMDRVYDRDLVDV